MLETVVILAMCRFPLIWEARSMLLLSFKEQTLQYSLNIWLVPPSCFRLPCFWQDPWVLPFRDSQLDLCLDPCRWAFNVVSLVVVTLHISQVHSCLSFLTGIASWGLSRVSGGVISAYCTCCFKQKWSNILAQFNSQSSMEQWLMRWTGW